MSPPPGWVELRRQLQEARDARQHGRLRDLLLEAVDLRLRSADGVALSAERLDFQLLFDLAGELRHAQRPEDALRIFAAGRALAGRQWEDAEARRFDLAGAQACIDVMDLDAAGAVLARAIGRPLEPYAAAVQAAARLAPPGGPVLALWGLARLWAAQGRLGWAERALEAALAVAGEVPTPGASEPDLAIALAEVRLDRGDLSGFDELRQARADRIASASESVRWQLLAATAAHLQGRLTDVKEALTSVLQAPGAEPGLLERARWLRAHARLALNQLDEAHEDLQGLTEAGESLQHLLEARRALSLGLGLQPQVGDDRLLERAAVPGSAPPDDEAGGSRPAPRRERVRDECARRFNAVQLALHRGATAKAARDLEALSEWVDLVDSPLLAARRAHLAALVAYHQGDLATATRRAATASEQYQRLGMPFERYSTCELSLRILRRTDPRSPRLDELAQESVALLKALVSGLRGPDRILVLLNKWSTMEEEASRRVRALQADQARPGGWWRRRTQRAAGFRVLADLLREQRWPVEEGAPSLEAEAPAPPGIGGLSAAARQARLHRSARADAVPFEALSPRHLPRDAAVLFYAVLPDRVVLFLVQSSGCALVTPALAAARPELWARVTEVLSALRFANRWSPGTARPPVLDTVARMLGLPEVLARLPARVKHLAVVPDSVVAHVPYAALHVDGRPLVERCSVSFVPRASWTPSVPAQYGRGGRGLAVKVSRTSLVASPELPLAEEEVAAFAGLGLDRLEILREEDATREVVLDALGRSELAHFVCHGDFKPEQPHASGLALASEWLTIGDLRARGMERLGLVVLDACLGASAAILPGREMISLPAAFLSQGARSVLAPLWEVAHEASRDFAQAFYARLPRLGPVEALADVQRAWIREGRRPTHWAPYAVYLDGVKPAWPQRWWLRARAWVRRGRATAPAAP